MTEPAKVANLLGGVRRILSHQKEVERLKGEKFNVFSILKMESQENGTHSAFLGELLNPRGSHLKGNTFLTLFLETVDMHQHIDAGSARVHLERYIGPRDDIAKTGGRVDIYIVDTKGNSLCIENKIYAGDQYAQIERYCNHNKEKNNVLYLTLTGHEPSAESKGVLVNGEDYYTISYRDDITAWLDRCIKESADLPIVRETIKQYKLLLKKMTTQIDNQYE